MPRRRDPAQPSFQLMRNVSWLIFFGARARRLLNRRISFIIVRIVNPSVIYDESPRRSHVTYRAVPYQNAGIKFPLGGAKRTTVMSSGVIEKTPSSALESAASLPRAHNASQRWTNDASMTRAIRDSRVIMSASSSSLREERFCRK